VGTADPLQRYRAKRDFGATPEPGPDWPAPSGSARALSFVVQKHDATRLHYDFRLELDGVLLSWAVPKGPSLDPADKRMAIRTEDHPLAYAGFEGRIPAGHYGAGEVIVWDRGTWAPLGDPRAGLATGKLAFMLAGHKLQGAFELVRLRDPQGGKEAWLLFKKRDAHARPRAEHDVVRDAPGSVLHATTRAPAALPATLAPQLATAAEVTPAVLAALSDETWLLETKFDGYRVLARVDDGEPRLFTRGGHDWTAKMPALADALRALRLTSAWLDGEIVVPGAHAGADDFNALQNAFDRGRTQRLVYWLFDLPFCAGEDLRAAPLQARRTLLAQLLRKAGAKDDGPVRFSPEVAGPVAPALESACRAGLEGLIAKRRDAPYRSTRSESWLKLKCQRRQEFVIGGFTLRARSRDEIGSLRLGVFDAEGRLRHAGSVGTGWDHATARALHERLAPLARKTSPLNGPGPSERWREDGERAETAWVEPRLVAEVRFAEWTPAGHVRHASFIGLRADKPAAAITREETVVAPAARNTASVAGVAITHADRVVDATSGATKLDVVRCLEAIAPRLLPHLKDRPVALLRAPQGVGGEAFFQKHVQGREIPGVRTLEGGLVAIDDVDGLVGAAQMNVLEFHPWNARTRDLRKPDRLVFDLDPGEGVAWPAVKEGALLVRALLDELGLAAWLKTSGGKGLHVVVPLAARRDVDEVKAFSQSVVQHLAATIPQRFVARSGPKNRVGKIFVDYLRNGYGATTAAAWSPRARPGLGVSVPVDWDELDTLASSAAWTVATLQDRLSFERSDPWAGFAQTKQTITAALRRLR
jgi:bifunctional non-homologous end joining protein LigD